MVAVYRNHKNSAGLLVRIEPKRRNDGYFHVTETTKSNEKPIPKATISEVAAWIEARRVSGKPGGVLMAGPNGDPNGLYTIKKVLIDY